MPFFLVFIFKLNWKKKKRKWSSLWQIFYLSCFWIFFYHFFFVNYFLVLIFLSASFFQCLNQRKWFKAREKTLRDDKFDPHFGVTITFLPTKRDKNNSSNNKSLSFFSLRNFLLLFYFILFWLIKYEYHWKKKFLDCKNKLTKIKKKSI